MTIPPRWTSLLARASLLYRMEPGDWFYQVLLARNIPEETIKEFISHECRPKCKAAIPATQEELVVSMGEALDRGGFLAGGAALAQVTKMYRSSDADIFFNDPATWAEFVVRFRNISTIEFCLYEKDPWETFDLSVVKLAIGKDGVIASDECREAMSTMISGIDIANLAYPELSINRCVKYHDRLGIAFNEDHLRLAYGLAGRKEDALFLELTEKPELV